MKYVKKTEVRLAQDSSGNYFQIDPDTFAVEVINVDGIKIIKDGSSIDPFYMDVVNELYDDYGYTFYINDDNTLYVFCSDGDNDHKSTIASIIHHENSCVLAYSGSYDEIEPIINCIYENSKYVYIASNLAFITNENFNDSEYSVEEETSNQEETDGTV